MPRIIVLGAGIYGLASALLLARDGNGAPPRGPDREQLLRLVG